jgi:hypothetical protein
LCGAAQTNFFLLSLPKNRKCSVLCYWYDSFQPNNVQNVEVFLKHYVD